LKKVYKEIARQSVLKKGRQVCLKTKRFTELKKEENYAKDLAKGERASDDRSITKEGMENCVKFPNSTPIEIIELYRKLDFQRRELEKQRMYTQDKLLKKEDKEIVMNENHKEKGMVIKVQQIDITKGGVHYCVLEQRDIIETNDMEESLNQHTDVLTKELKENLEQYTEMLSERKKVMRPYIFNSDNFFMIIGFDEDETNMFQVEESVLELKKTGSCQVEHVVEEKKHEDTMLEEVKLIVRINQGIEGQLLRVVKEEEGKYAGIDEQHSDVIERNQVQRELEDNLFFENKFTDIEQSLFGKQQEGKDERAVVRIQ